MNKRILPISLLGLCGLFNINCASDDQDGQDSDEGIILLSLAQAPVDARCLQVTIAGSRTVESFIDLQPGQTTTVQIDRLPLGIATVDGHAFSTMTAQAVTGVRSMCSPPSKVCRW